jgi:hypothetical protein
MTIEELEALEKKMLAAMEAEKNGGKVIAGAPFTLVGARLRSLLLSHR